MIAPSAQRCLYEARLLALLERSGTVRSHDLGYRKPGEAEPLLIAAGMTPARRATTARWETERWVAGPKTIDWMIIQKLRAEQRQRTTENAP